MKDLNWKKILKIGLPTAGAIIALIYFFKSSKSKGKAEPIKEKMSEFDTSPYACIEVSRKKFPVEWGAGEGDKKRPSGTIGDIAEKYFPERNKYAGGVGGFFKGIDVFPSMSAAKFYQDEMIAWINSKKGGLEWWNMIQGELSCIVD